MISFNMIAIFTLDEDFRIFSAIPNNFFDFFIQEDTLVQHILAVRSFGELTLNETRKNVNLK